MSTSRTCCYPESSPTWYALQTTRFTFAFLTKLRKNLMKLLLL